MTSYELSRLNDKEFEEMAVQLVSIVVGQRVERFKSGKDQGVDGRYFLAGGEGIVQAKHWLKSGLAALLKHLAETEAPKVRKLCARRYFLVTSVELSRENKRTIKAIFDPHVLSESDILGQEDIQDLLRDNPEIPRQHYKLWLASSDVLHRIYSAPLIGRSAFKLEEAVSFAPKYVPTRCHEDALIRLQLHGTIIIIGEPGIGKSTLAEQIAIQFAADGYELCFIEHDVTEFEGKWEPDKPQLFYFDDFLGRNYLDVIDGNKDSHVLAFLRRVQKDKSKRFVLTSRTTILQQGKSLSELFRIYNIAQQEFEVRVTDLSEIEKARILYNHLWFGDLESAFIDELYKDKRYRLVIKHRNFNPRLISFITDQHKIAGVSVTPDSYWDYVHATLENPRDIWRGVFDNQLDRMGRLIVSLVVFHGEALSERSLRAAVERARQQTVPPPAPAEWGLEFERSFQMCVGAIITRNLPRQGGEAKIDLFNPSVGDFVIHRFFADPASLESFLGLLQDENALVRFDALRRGKLIADDTYVRVMSSLFKRFWPSRHQVPEFPLSLSRRVLKHGGLKVIHEADLNTLGAELFEITRLTTEILNLPVLAEHVATNGLLDLSDDHWMEVVTKVTDQTSDDEILAALSAVIEMLESPIREEAEEALVEHVVDSWKERIHDAIVDDGALDDYYDTDLHWDRACDRVRRFVKNITADYHIEFSEERVDAIIQEVDVIKIMSDNQDSLSSEERSGPSMGGTSGAGSEEAQIDDLFERER